MVAPFDEGDLSMAPDDPDDVTGGDVASGVAIAGPTAQDPGNVPGPGQPDPDIAYHVYTRDLATTGATYTPGAPVDTVLIRQWIQDEGYPVVGVTAQTDLEGRPTGVVEIATNLLATPLDIALSQADGEIVNNAMSTYSDIVASTPVGGVATYTYSGQVRFAAEMISSANPGTVTFAPVVDGSVVNITTPEADPDWRDVETLIDLVSIDDAGTLGLKMRSQFVVTRNEAWNPSFEVNDTDGGWQWQNVTHARDTTKAYAGIASERLTLSVGSGTAALVSPTGSLVGSRWATTPGTISTFSAYAVADATGRTMQVAIQFRNASGTLITTEIGDVVTLGTGTDWQRLVVTAEAPPLTAFATGVVYVLGGTMSGGGNTTGDQFWVDAIQFETGIEATDYFDGSTGSGYEWTAITHGSPSVRVATATMRNATITGTLVPDQVPGVEIPVVTWNTFAGARAPAHQFIVDWGFTDEADHVSQPDVDRVYGFWLHLEAHGITVDRIETHWNLRHPETAPDPPDLYTFVDMDIPSDVVMSYLYSDLPAADRDLFEAKYDIVSNTTTIRRKVRGQPDIDDYQYSSAMLWIPPEAFVALGTTNAVNVAKAYQVGRQVAGDLVRVQLLQVSPTFIQRRYFFRYTGDGTLSGGQYLAADYTLLGTSDTDPLAYLDREGSLAIGERALIDTPNGTIVGVGSEMHGESSVAFGTRARVLTGHDRAGAIGADATSVANDSLVLKFNALRLVRSLEDPFSPTSRIELFDGSIYRTLYFSTTGALMTGSNEVPIANGSLTQAMMESEIRRLLETPHEVYRGKGTQEDTGTFGTASNPYLHLTSDSIGTPPNAGTYEGYIRFELMIEQRSGNVTTINIYPQIDGSYLSAITRAIPAELNKPLLVAGNLQVSISGGAAHTSALGIRPSSAGTSGNFRIYWSMMRGTLRRIS